MHSFKNRYARRPCVAKLAGSAAHDEPLLTPHAHFGLVVAMGQGNSQGELAGDPRGIARFYPALEMAMWQGDSQGDSLGIPGGFARLLGDSL